MRVLYDLINMQPKKEKKKISEREAHCEIKLTFLVSTTGTKQSGIIDRQNYIDAPITRAKEKAAHEVN